MATITLAGPDAPAPDAIALVAFADAPLPAGYAALDAELGGLISGTLARREAKAGKGSIVTAYPQPSTSGGITRVLLVGLGDAERFTSETLRLAMAKLVQAARAANLQAIDLRIVDGLGNRLSERQIGHAVADGLSIAAFELGDFKGAATAGGPDGSSAGAAAADRWEGMAVHVEPAVRDAVDAGLRIGMGMSTARRLAATPPNVAHPRYIADQCRSLAEEVGLRFEVIDAARAAELGMGGLLAVGRAGSHEPRLIVLEWQGAQGHGDGAQANDRTSSPTAPLLLVGKTITFDTGGYSLKVGGSMAGMKYDKCGGMAVIGAMEAIARLNLPGRVVGILPCAENMVDEKAFRVDDILTLCNGVTVEVTNTDAEGRLVLADALAYGTRTYAPAAVIDLATLTGGVRVALGPYCAGMFCNDDALRARIEQAADFTGERVWRLPLWDDHRDQMTPGKAAGAAGVANPADLVNSADRQAHPIQGAAFLSFFVGDDAPRRMPTLPWAHLDIAGTATAENDAGLFPKGPTAWGVRLLAELAAHQSA